MSAKKKITDVQIDAPHKTIKADILSSFNLLPALKSQPVIPKGFYNIKQLMESSGVGLRTVSKKLKKLQEENKLETLTVRDFDTLNRPCHIKYYKAKK